MNQRGSVPNLKGSNIEYVSLSGGGARGVAYCGVIRALHEFGITPHVKGWAGSSIGAFFALAGCLSASPDKLEKKIINTDGRIFLDASKDMFGAGGLIGLFSELGLARGEKLRLFVEDFLSEMGVPGSATFEDLYRITGKTLVIVVTCLTTRQTLYMSYWTYPLIQISEAIRASMGIPIVFQPIIMKDPLIDQPRYLVDGGLYDNDPIRVFDYLDDNGVTLGYNRRVLNFLLDNGLWGRNYTDVSNIRNFGIVLLTSLHDRLQQQFFREPHFWDRTVVIDTLGVKINHFDVSKRIKKRLFLSGYLNTSIALRKRFHEKDDDTSSSIFIPSCEASKQGLTLDDRLIYRTLLYSLDPLKGSLGMFHRPTRGDYRWSLAYMSSNKTEG